MEFLNLPVYQDLVSPHLCQRLQRFGVTANTSFHYRLTAGITEINSYAFDKDDYYVKADANVNFISGVGIVPAYTLKDVEKALPPYLLTRQENGYLLVCDNIYGLPEQTAQRLPDAFAQMLLAGIKDRLIKVEYTNRLITAGA